MATTPRGRVDATAVVAFRASRASLSLSRARRAVSPRRRSHRHRQPGTRATADDADARATAITTGTVRAHGVDGHFVLARDVDGAAFVERVELAESLTTTSGRDNDGATWDADWFGDARANALDGAETSSMMTWVRTNQWNGGARGRVRVKKLAEGATAEAALRRFSVEAPKSSSRVESKGAKGKKRRGGRERRSDAPKPPKCACAVYAISILDGGKVGGRVFVDEATGFAWRAEFYHQRGVERWLFEGWERMVSEDGREAFTPALAHRTSAEGQVTMFRARETTFAASAMSFSKPESSVADWSPKREWSSAAGAVSTCRGEGGHILVKPKLESADGATTSSDWFVLDTASTGFAVTGDVADAVSMSAFGTMSITGVAAPLEGAMRRGHALSLGPLTLSSPLFMEQNLDGAIRVPGGERLGGVLGMPALAHAVVRLRAPMRVAGSRDAPKLEVTVVKRDEYAPTAEVERAWQPVTFIDGVPYVRLAYTIADDGFAGIAATTMEREGLFKLALGVGGVGAMLSAKVAAASNLANRTKALQPGGIMSGPGENTGRLQRVGGEIVTGRVAAVRFKNFEFINVRAVAHLDGDPPDADLSPHADGAVCADLFRGCTVVFDLASDRPRVAVVPP